MSDVNKAKKPSVPGTAVAEVDVSGERFLAAAARRQQILDTINETQHAKAALYQTRQDLFALGDEYGNLSTTAEKMKEATAREKKEWMKLKSSKLRKLFHPATHTAELKKEEDEYYEAYEWQLRAEAAAKEIGKQSAALGKKKDELLKQAELHREAQVQLLDLYEELFDGPTPNYPEEDKMEANCNALQEVLDSVQGKITHTYNVCEVLGPTRAALNAALKLARTSEDTMLSNIGGMTANLVGDMVKPEHARPASDGPPRLITYDATGGTLERIRRLLAAADQSMAAAQRLDPTVMAHVLPRIDPSNRARITGRVDCLLNAPLTDIIFYQEIAEAGEALETVARVVAEEADGWDARLEALRQERRPLEEELRRCREDLYELRTKLFDDATSPPPQYSMRRARDEEMGDEVFLQVSWQGRMVE
ncbi:hypothetical protein ISF_07852 [Cordyceps fumosorosea ARSEF 2679]|uniref:Uncharacterized protein n=1 Tax=Cordyceps fumosorosea (strain ARSEF 2679) TaxID=1081104 RepID=A0A167NNB1_CORFA|nr:hypothetical protein ISF_07852 [Cordyceps fumosorosea ARSEF 2679]OAA55747.1 hypothetical protein ISF_07852 [Cordyceps fumosorosea ARSEF 2679]